MWHVALTRGRTHNSLNENDNLIIYPCVCVRVGGATNIMRRSSAAARHRTIFVFPRLSVFDGEYHALPTDTQKLHYYYYILIRSLSLLSPLSLTRRWKYNISHHFLCVLLLYALQLHLSYDFMCIIIILVHGISPFRPSKKCAHQVFVRRHARKS